MKDQTNVRVDKGLLEKIDSLHSGAFSRGHVVDMMLRAAVVQWEDFLQTSGEIDVCKEYRVGEYLPVQKPWQSHKSYDLQRVKQQQKEFREAGL